MKNGELLSDWNVRTNFWVLAKLLHIFSRKRCPNSGNMARPTGNNIQYRKWVDNSALFMFDLTVTGRSSQTSDIMSPIVKTGDTRLDVTFGGEPTLSEMKLVVLQEFPSLFTISKGRSLNFSYFSSVHWEKWKTWTWFTRNMCHFIRKAKKKDKNGYG